MCWTFPAFVLYLPTMTAFFGAYAFSRLHDLTWGSRPSDSLLSMGILGLNSVAAPAPLGPGALNPERRTALLQEIEAEIQRTKAVVRAQIQARAHSICALIVIGNLLSVIIVISKLQEVPWGMIALGAFIFGTCVLLPPPPPLMVRFLCRFLVFPDGILTRILCGPSRSSSARRMSVVSPRVVRVQTSGDVLSKDPWSGPNCAKSRRSAFAPESRTVAA
jgi:hypothetical protein